jgi:hypothetical protein
MDDQHLHNRIDRVETQVDNLRSMLMKILYDMGRHDGTIDYLKADYFRRIDEEKKAKLGVQGIEGTKEGPST